jgi:hypothetical protein
MAVFLLIDLSKLSTLLSVADVMRSNPLRVEEVERTTESGVEKQEGSYGPAESMSSLERF